MNEMFDIFISHSVLDDEILSNGKTWIDNLEHFLQIILTNFLKRPVKILKSRDFENQTKIDDNLKLTLPVSTCFIFILSKNYLKDENSKNELAGIIQQISDSDNCLFKVSKIIENLGTTPSQLSAFLNYDFSSVRFDISNVENYDEILRAEKETNWFKIVDLAYDILAILLPDFQRQNKTEKPYVFLAECGKDLKSIRDGIKRDLIRHGYNVFPNISLPDNSNALTKLLNSYFSKSIMAIHLISYDFDDDYIDKTKSLVEFENEVANEFSKNQSDKNPVMYRYIWVAPSNLQLSDETKSRIEILKRDSESKQNVEVIQTPVEIFKSLIHLKLKEIQKHNFSISSGKLDNSLKSVYLISEKNCDESIEIENLLKNKNYAVNSNQRVIAENELHTFHREALIHSDSIVILHTTKNNQWINTKLQDLLKAPGYGRVGEFKPKILIILGHNKDVLKQAEKIYLKVFEIKSVENKNEALQKIVNEEFN